MYIVAVTRWGRPLQEEIADLSALLGMQPYDLRLRLAGPLPVVVARLSDPERARDLLGKLRERGHGAVACDGDKILASDRMMTPRTFELGETSMTVIEPTQRTDRIPYSQLLALVHARLETETRLTTTSESRKFSAGRAVMTGGIVFSKKVSKQVRDQESEYEQVMYLFRRSGKDHLILRQNVLRYSGLGSEIGHSTAENFSRLVKAIRKRAPEALYDDRLLTRKRRSTVDSMSKTKADRNRSVESVSTSNVQETDLAAYLIAVAHHGGQL
jgi:hypothetical protein